MNKIKTEYSIASAAARDYLDSRNDRSSVASDILSIDLVHKMNIFGHPETDQKHGINE